MESMADFFVNHWRLIVGVDVWLTMAVFAVMTCYVRLPEATLAQFRLLRGATWFIVPLAVWLMWPITAASGPAIGFWLIGIQVPLLLGFTIASLNLATRPRSGTPEREAWNERALSHLFW